MGWGGSVHKKCFVHSPLARRWGVVDKKAHGVGWGVGFRGSVHKKCFACSPLVRGWGGVGFLRSFQLCSLLGAIISMLQTQGCQLSFWDLVHGLETLCITFWDLDICTHAADGGLLPRNAVPSSCAPLATGMRKLAATPSMLAARTCGNRGCSA